MTPIDQNLYRSHLTRSYPFAPNKCFDAAQKALIEDLKTPVEKADATSMTIWSGRAVIWEGATGSSNGYQASAEKIRDEHRITLQIEGSGNQCTVRTTKWEFWSNNVKLNDVNLDYAQPHFFNPLLEGIADHLARGQ